MCVLASIVSSSSYHHHHRIVNVVRSIVVSPLFLCFMVFFCRHSTVKTGRTLSKTCGPWAWSTADKGITTRRRACTESERKEKTELTNAIPAITPFTKNHVTEPQCFDRAMSCRSTCFFLRLSKDRSSLSEVRSLECTEYGILPCKFGA